MNPKKLWQALKISFKQFSADKVLRLAAALAYYAMFSIGPLLVIAVGVAGLAMGKEQVRNQVQQQLQGMLGANSAKTLESMMAAQKHGTSVITTIVGIVALLFGAGGVFGQLQDALNTIWEVESKPGTGIWGLVRQRFLSLTMVLGAGFLLLVSMALTTFLNAGMGSLGDKLPMSEGIAHALNFIVSFAIISLLFAMIFKYLPDVKVPFRVVWFGAILTAFLFTVGKYGLALYLGRASTTSTYGAAGSVIVIMMWVYYASIILLYGVEFTHGYARATGTEVVPDRYAVPVTKEQRAQQGLAPEKQGGLAPIRNKSRNSQPEGRRHESEHMREKPAAVAADIVAEHEKRIARQTGEDRTDWLGSYRPGEYVPVLVAAGIVGGLLLRNRLLRRAVQLFAESR